MVTVDAGLGEGKVSESSKNQITLNTQLTPNPHSHTCLNHSTNPQTPSFHQCNLIIFASLLMAVPDGRFELRLRIWTEFCGAAALGGLHGWLSVRVTKIITLTVRARG